METADFLPERIRVQRARRSRFVRQLVLTAICAVGLGGLAMVRHVQVCQAREQCDLLEKGVLNVQHQMNLRKDLEDQRARLALLLQIDERLGSRVNALTVLAELDRLMPANISLTSLHLEAVEVKAPVEFVPKGIGQRVQPIAVAKSQQRFRLVLRGLAPSDVDMANFIGQLSASPLLEDVNMNFTRTTEFRGREAREFQASCYLVK